MKQARWIMHVDMDAFFAAVEQRDNEEYRGKPVIVGGLSSRGVVSTASYEARKYGVHSAMPMSKAKRLCPMGIFVAGRHDVYEKVSHEIFAILAKYSPLVEPLSIDEAFLDVTGMERLTSDLGDYARKLKEEIKEKTSLVASVGIAPNKFLAKLASDLEKPNGLTIITPDNISEKVLPLSLSKIWGVGKVTATKLRDYGYKTIGDIAQSSIEELSRAVGIRLAQQLNELANGHDDRPVVVWHEAKSIGREITFEKDIYGYEEAKKALLYLAEDVGWRLRLEKRKAQTISIKVRTASFETVTRQMTLLSPTFFDEDIYKVATELFLKLAPKGAIRLLGITGTNLDDVGELSLFDNDEKKEKLYSAIDCLKKRFGEGIITKAQLLQQEKKKY